jgi:serine/threonine-protein kinase
MSVPANPEKIGRYQILERVGRGGMGVLLRGIDPVLDREVAIKLMALDFTEDADQMRPRFYREARAAAKLQHPNIVTIFEFAEEGNTPYIVMEFLRGSSLQGRLASPLPLTLDEKLHVIIQLCSALNYAHEQGVVHRDIKPANIFLLPDGSVKLLDFGVAKLATSTLTRQGDVLGSAMYMSPEQVSGSGNVDGRSDIFSTGVVLYEILANRKPFQADTLTATVVKLLREDPPSLDEVAPGLPAQLVSAVKKSLAKEPAGRFATAAEMAKELSWIRQALQASDVGAGPLDETRFASATQLFELNKTLEKDRLQAESPSSTARAAAPPAERKWLLPVALVVGALAIVILSFAVGRGTSGGSNAPPAPQAAATPTAAPQTTAPQPGAPAATAQPAAGTAPAPAPETPPATAATDVASLQIESEPAGASIVFDGQPTSQVTPAAVKLTGPGPHRVRLSKPGFVAQEITLTDANLKQGAVSVTLAAAEAAAVAVTIASSYPVEVLSGSQTVSRASQSHRLKIASGTTLRVVSKPYMLNETVRVGSRALDYQVPAPGFLSVFTTHETCDVKIGGTVLGAPPITKHPIASGTYKVEVACEDGPSPPGTTVTVPPNGSETARIR